MKAWWFSAGYTLPHGDGRPVCLGITHKMEGPIIPCKRGFHGSIYIMDALKYAPGPILWRVELGGKIVPHEKDKLAASERTYLAGGINTTETLREFACLCALDVIHLWDAPEIVIQYLKTRDESLRGAAWDATWDAARDAARDATWDAARGAARDAAWGVARKKQSERLEAMVLQVIGE